MSCEQALSISLEDQESRAPVEQPSDPVSTPPTGPERVDAEEDEDNGRMKIRMVGKIAADLPGGRPGSLPLQPLEGRPEDLLAVSKVLARAEAGGRVRISVFGASHTGADFFTGHLRRLLQRRYGDIGHGFIFPAALYKGYRGNDINLCRSDGWKSDWVGRSGGRGDGLHGFAGATVSSADPADFGWLETTHTNVNGRAVSRYDIFSLSQPDGGTLLVTVDEVPPRAIFTESPDLGLLWHRLEVPDGPHRLTVQPIGDGEVRLFGISAEREGPGVLVDAMGIRGRTARTWLFWQPEIARQGLQALDPDMVVLAYGTNEAADTHYRMGQYRVDLRKVLEMMRRGSPDAACVLIGPTDRGGYLGRNTIEIWKRTAMVAQVQREVAPEYGCVFWDWQEAMGGEGSIAAWRLVEPTLAGRDLIHLSQAGYEWSAERFLEAMERASAE
jgi:lysophospholipase L1-like esterase